MADKKKRKSIRSKLLVSYFSLVALILLIGVTSIYNIMDVNSTNIRLEVTKILIVMVLSIIIAIIITIKMSEYFTVKLAAIQRLARRISEYNISDDIVGITDDEFGRTVEALNDSQFMIRELMEKIIDESATISDTGEEISLAVRKAGQRIEKVNVQILNFDEMAGRLDGRVQGMLKDRSLDEEIVANLNNILKGSAEAREILLEARSELSGVAMYLEQIGITSDYQNEIANSHKDQVQKFKV